MLTLQAQGWDFTPSLPTCPPLRGTFSGIAVAKICLKPVRVLWGLLLEEGILLRLCVLIVVLVVVSLICREEWEEGRRREELKLWEAEKVCKNLFPGMDSPFLLQLIWELSGSRDCVILRTKGAVQVFLGVGRAHPAPGMATPEHRWPQLCPHCCSWRALGLWLLSWLLRWQMGRPRGDRGGGALQAWARAPCAAPQPGEMLMAVASTVRKGDLDSYKKGFSFSSYLDHQHHCCCSVRQDLHWCTDACCMWGHRNPFQGKSEGSEGLRHLHVYVAPCPQNPFRGARAWHSRHVLKSPSLSQRSLQPPSSQHPPWEPVAGGTCSFACLRLGGPVD